MIESLTPIVLTLITGPVGSGKSRLINALRAGSSMAMLGMANEAGKTALQGAVMNVPAHIADGCLCCRSGAFAGVLEQLMRDIDNARQARPEHLLFETSGTADPILLLSEVIRHPYLSRRYQIGAVAMPLAHLPPEHTPQDLVRQIEACSFFVGESAPWQKIIDRLNPNASIVAAADAQAAILEARFDIARRSDAARRRLYAGSRSQLARNL